MIKKLFTVPAAAALSAALLFSSCETLEYFGKSSTAKYLEQAFGDAIRSLEASGVKNIPAAIQELRAKWLPAGQQYTDLAAKAIRSYIAAHPTNPAEVNKVLEAIATGLQA